MSDRKFWLRAVCALACVALIPLLATAQTSSEEDAAGVEDIVQAVHSFQQLAVLDPVSAGEIWMDGRTASDWKKLVERVVDDVFDASILFGHVIPFAEVSENGVHAGLYNPWVGSLLVFTYDARASLIEGFAFYAADQLTGAWADPERFALAAMAAIDSAYQLFVEVLGGDEPREMSSRDVEYALDQTRPTLAVGYGLIKEPSIAQANVEAALELVFADELAFPLDLLDDGSPIWRGTLQPVWIAETSGPTFLVLASSASPLDWVWLEIATDPTDQPILSVSLMKLYDSIVTRGGEDS